MSFDVKSNTNVHRLRTLSTSPVNAGDIIKAENLLDFKLHFLFFNYLGTLQIFLGPHDWEPLL